jgi:hypothetical protein
MAIMQHKSKTYEEFVDKFKPKKTTDDCYTPEAVYNAVTDFVAEEYGVDPVTFTRPFWPGADYTEHDYDGKIVVDNPPFSILGQIIKYYNDNDIKYFLFAPSLTVFTYVDRCDIVLIRRNVVYENGAKVQTAFVTNLKSKQHDYKVFYSEKLDKMITDLYTRAKPRTPRPANYWSSCDCVKHHQSIPRSAYVSKQRKTPDGKEIFGCAAETTIYRNEE